MAIMRDLLATVVVMIVMGASLIILPVVGGILAVLVVGIVVFALIRDHRLTTKHNQEVTLESPKTKDD